MRKPVFLKQLVTTLALMLIGLLVVAPAMAQPNGGAAPAAAEPAAAAGPQHPKALEAKAAFDQKDAFAALKALDEMHRADQNAWRASSPLIEQIFKAAFNEAKTLIDQSKPERAIALADQLSGKAIEDLFGRVYPNNKSALSDVIRQTYGIAHWQLGSKSQNRGNRDGALEEFTKATTYLKPGDPFFARTCAAMGSLLMERAADATRRKDIEGVKNNYNMAAASFVYARDNAGSDKSVLDAANLALSQIAATGLELAVPGLPTPTPAPTATPAVGLLDSIAAGGFTQGVSNFFRNIGKNPDAQKQALLYLGLVFAFIVVYWVIPVQLMRRFMLKGDIRAAEFLPYVKYFGPFTFIAYLKGMKREKAKVEEPVQKQPCPNCGFNLFDMYAYEDLVFSKCPKCKTKIAPLFSVETYVTQLSASLGSDVEKVNVGAISLEKYVAKDAVVRLVRAIITLAVRRRASDIHVEPDEEALHIRQRIDGVITEMCRLPRSLSLALVSALKVQGGMNIAEKRLPQDGKFQIRVDKTDIDVRAASSPTGVGEKISLRILDVRSIQMETKHLGMAAQAQETFEAVIHQPHGMMLVTGPTGSGKTTTIYIALQDLKAGDKNIISIEDPIEFRIPGVNQIQINPTAGLTFASGLRSILRQDPDVIVIGEIRDKETAEIAVSSSTTGHMVFSTLHTVDAASGVARLIDLGVSPRQFADALSLIVAQRLIRLVCQYCKQPGYPDDNQLRELGLNRVLVDGFDFQVGKGCQVCNSTGYYRRTGIFELLSPSERLRSALEAGGLSTSQIRDIAVQAGMRTLRQEAIVLLQQGVTTVDETIRVTK